MQCIMMNPSLRPKPLTRATERRIVCLLIAMLQRAEQ
jgi:hypothetical protein